MKFDFNRFTPYNFAQKELYFSVTDNGFEFWLELNKANESNFHDGKYWTFNTVKALGKIFPYVSERKIRNALKHLQDENIIITGNYNKSAYDGTLWYAFTDFAESILQKRKMEDLKKSNRKRDNVEPIPDNNTYNNADNTTDDSMRGAENRTHAPPQNTSNEQYENLISDSAQHERHGNKIATDGNKITTGCEKIYNGGVNGITTGV